MGREKDKRYVDPKDVYNYMVANKGVSPTHAIGILSNIQAESAFNASAIGDKGTSGGLFQHHDTRFSGLKKHAGDDWTNWQKQVDYALSEGASKKYLEKQFKTPEEASMWWTTEWERPANKHTKAKERVNNINKFSSFTEYTATPYVPAVDDNGKTTGTKYNPGVIQENPEEKPVRFEIVTADGPTIMNVDPIEFKKELKKVKTIEDKVSKSEARQSIEKKKRQQKEFLNAMGVSSKHITTYDKDDYNTDIPDPETVAKLDTPSSLPKMPSIFSMGT